MDDTVDGNAAADLAKYHKLTSTALVVYTPRNNGPDAVNLNKCDITK